MSNLLSVGQRVWQGLLGRHACYSTARTITRTKERSRQSAIKLKHYRRLRYPAGRLARGWLLSSPCSRTDATRSGDRGRSLREAGHLDGPTPQPSIDAYAKSASRQRPTMCTYSITREGEFT